MVRVAATIYRYRLAWLIVSLNIMQTVGCLPYIYVC